MVLKPFLQRLAKNSVLFLQKDRLRGYLVSAPILSVTILLSISFVAVMDSDPTLQEILDDYYNIVWS